jgi:flavin reductase (DIM6/NTAB) family NADH-FMN oxidoreductase RutF
MAKRTIGPTNYLFPMPAVLVAVRVDDEETAILTVAWVGIVGGDPPLLALNISRSHYSTPHLEREGTFTLNIPCSRQAVAVDYCGIVSGRQDRHKWKTCGWTLERSELVSAPFIAECPVNLECKLVQRVDTASGGFYLAEVLQTHIDEEAINEAGILDATVVDPLVFNHDGWYYALTDRLVPAFSAGKRLLR